MPAFNKRFQLNRKFGVPVKALVCLMPLTALWPIGFSNITTIFGLICLFFSGVCIYFCIRITAIGDELPFQAIKKIAKQEMGLVGEEAWEKD